MVVAFTEPPRIDGGAAGANDDNSDSRLKRNLLRATLNMKRGKSSPKNLGQPLPSASSSSALNGPRCEGKCGSSTDLTAHASTKPNSRDESGAVDLGWGAEQVEQVVHHRGQTRIDVSRLQTFNFTTTDSGVITPLNINIPNLTPVGYKNYTSSVLRFAPVEVASRLYGYPVPSPTHFFNGYSSVINGDEGRHLGVQAYEHGFDAAVLFSDISGFTKLTNRLIAERDKEGAEILNQIINRFFEELIAIIHRHAGDVIKFAGDAVLSIWSSSASGDRIQDLTRRAVACALEQIEKMHHWDTKEGVHLQLHLGLGAGTVLGVDLGNQFRREYVVAGEPLKQLSEAEQQASSGQLVVSPQAWDYVREVCTGTEAPDGEFGPGFHIVHTISSTLPSAPCWRAHLLEHLLKDKQRSKPALEALYLYVPGTLRPHLVSGELSKASEFREVTMMFIRIGGLHYSDPLFAARFQRVVFMILSSVYKYQGSLSRLSIDDKGTCAKVTFGLPPLYHNDDPARAVRCALLIRDHVRPLRLKANIGITTGTVFIGYVGASTRGEYTEYGVMVNMAARLMGKAVNEVLVNGSTYTKASLTDTLDFDELQAVQMKGMDAPVPMYRAVGVIDARYYEPDEIGLGLPRTVESGRLFTGQTSVRMVGQTENVARITEMLLRYQQSRHGFLCVVRGESGMGKTKLIEEVENTLGPQHGLIPIQARAMATESSGQLFVWKSILQALPRALGLLGDGMPGRHQQDAKRSSQVEMNSKMHSRSNIAPAPMVDPLSAHHSSIKQLRNIFRAWLYEKQHEVHDMRARTHHERHADRASRMLDDGHSLLRIGEELRTPSRHRRHTPLHTAARTPSDACASLGSVREDAADNHVEHEVNDAAEAATPHVRRVSSQATHLPRAKSIRRRDGSHPSSKLATEYRVSAGIDRVGGFEQNESLLNDVLECDFPVHDATLDLSEDVRAEMTMQMLTQIMHNALSADEGKVLLLIEDVQWMDSASWTLLRRVVEVVPSAAVILTTSLMDIDRGVTELSVDSRRLMRGALATHLRLEKLGHEEVRQLLCVHLGVAIIQKEVVDHITRRTAGNALYSIEIAKMMVERQERLSRHWRLACRTTPSSHPDHSLTNHSLHTASHTPTTSSSYYPRLSFSQHSDQTLHHTLPQSYYPNRAVVLRCVDSNCSLSPDVEDLDAVGLPTSLHGAISAQLDKLPPYCVAILKAASVVGMQFPVKILEDAFQLEGLKSIDDRRKTMNQLAEMKMIEYSSDSSFWTQLLFAKRDGDGVARRSVNETFRPRMDSADVMVDNGVYRFCSWTCREVAYNSLPFEQRRQYHLSTAKWLESAVAQLLVLKTAEASQGGFKLWLYPMLADHWMQVPAGGGSGHALKYLEEAGRCCLETNMHYEAIRFFRKMLKLHELNPDSDDTVVARARVYDLLAEAYLAEGRVKPAKEVVCAALGLLDEGVTGPRSVMLRRVGHEVAWLTRPLVLKKTRSMYHRPARRLELEVEMMVVRLYEHLGRIAYLLDERELHDLAVLRCANLAMLLRRRASKYRVTATTSGLTVSNRCTKEQWHAVSVQLARAHAAACLSLSMLSKPDLARTFGEMAMSLAESLNDPPELTLYVNTLMGVHLMRECEWKPAESCLRRACSAAEPFTGRRAEEAANMLGFTLYMSGQLRSAHRVYEAAREQCVVRHDPQMLGQLTIGVCVGLLMFQQQEEALLLLSTLAEVMPANQQNTVTSANASATMAVCFLRDGLFDDAQQSASIALGLLKTKGRKTHPSAFWVFANAIGVILSMPAPIGGTDNLVVKRQHRRTNKSSARSRAVNQRRGDVPGHALRGSMTGSRQHIYRIGSGSTSNHFGSTKKLADFLEEPPDAGAPTPEPFELRNNSITRQHRDRLRTSFGGTLLRVMRKPSAKDSSPLPTLPQDEAYVEGRSNSAAQLNGSGRSTLPAADAEPPAPAQAPTESVEMSSQLASSTRSARQDLQTMMADVTPKMLVARANSSKLTRGSTATDNTKSPAPSIRPSMLKSASNVGSAGVGGDAKHSPTRQSLHTRSTFASGSVFASGVWDPSSLEENEYLNEVEINFAAIREAIDDFLAYGRANPVAMPRALLYESTLQARCGEVTAAIATLQGAVEEAIAQHMPYDEALCRGELGMLTEDADMVQEARRLLAQLGAIADEEKHRMWLNSWPGGCPVALDSTPVLDGPTRQPSYPLRSSAMINFSNGPVSFPAVDETYENEEDSFSALGDFSPEQELHDAGKGRHFRLGIGLRRVMIPLPFILECDLPLRLAKSPLAGMLCTCVTPSSEIHSVSRVRRSLSGKV
ncbi:hypothetical protein AB1Y20_006366 [Prymnesium parvum]|uniref:Guanylate cyclase domain-containing protein n=1 Tax=Prymnesium parvum TaxID=97485 RepID=A0AB34J2G2_PRYPA